MTRRVYVRSFPASSDSSCSVGQGDWPIDANEILLHPQELERLHVTPFGHVHVSRDTPEDSSYGSHHIENSDEYEEFIAYCRVVPDDSLAPGEALVPGWIMRSVGALAGENMRVSQVELQVAEFPSCSEFVASFVSLEHFGHDPRGREHVHGEKLTALTQLSLSQAIARRVAGCLVCVGSLIAAEILGQMVVLRVTEMARDGVALEARTVFSDAAAEPREILGDSTGLGQGHANVVEVCKVTCETTISFQSTKQRSVGSLNGGHRTLLKSSSPARSKPSEDKSNVGSRDISIGDSLRKFDPTCGGRTAWSKRTPSHEDTLYELLTWVLLALRGLEQIAPASRDTPDASYTTMADSSTAGGRQLRISDVLPKGIALCGPSGIGKSLVLDVLHDDLRDRHGVHAVRLDGPQILAGFSHDGSGSSGESTKTGTLLTRALDEARDNAPAVVLVDELDAVFDSMSGAENPLLGEGAAVAATLLAALDVASSIPGVVVLAATRRSPGGAQGAGWTDVEAEAREGHRPAMPANFRKPGRFEKVVEMLPPSQLARKQILRVLLHAPGWKLEALESPGSRVVIPTGDDPTGPAGYDAGGGAGPVSGTEESTAGMLSRASGEMVGQERKQVGGLGREMSEEGPDEQAAIAAEWAQRLSSVTPGMLAGDLHRLVRNMRTRAARRRSSSGYALAPSSIVSQVEHAVAKPESTSLSFVAWQDALGAVASTVPRALGGVDVLSSAREGARSGPTWASVGGFLEARRRLQRLVQWPWQHRGAFERMGISAPAGALLFGPSGCGKSLVAQVLANECRANFVWVRSSELLSRYLGETEAKLRGLFAKARAAAPCILFIDELDAITSKRGDGDGGSGDAGVGAAGVHSRVLSTLLNEMDGVAASGSRAGSGGVNISSCRGDQGSVLVLAATNRRDALDAALLRPGRLHESVELGMPSREDREGVLRVHASRLPLSRGIDLERLSWDDVSGGLTCADIEASCRDAAMMALRDDLQGAHEVRPEHLRKALHDRVAGRLKTRRFTFCLGKGLASQ